MMGCCARGLFRDAAGTAAHAVPGRARAGDDRRGMEITVTDAGQAALLAAIDSHLQLVASLFTDRLTATDRAALGRVLPKLLAKPTPECETSQEE
jgi:hypothetical protein